MELTYRNIARETVGGFFEMNTAETEHVLFTIGKWIDGDGNRALQFPDARPVGIKSWDQVKKHEILNCLDAEAEGQAW